MNKVGDTYSVVLYVNGDNINNCLLERHLALETTGTVQIEESQLQALGSIDMAQVEKVSTKNACIAVMGYEPSDEQTICKFYNKSTGGCFKSGHCTKKHQKINPDGWTSDKRSGGYFYVPSLIIPRPETFINIEVTHVTFPTVFHGLYYHDNVTQLGQFDSLSEFANYLNDPAIISTFKKLTREPVVGELVIASYTCDGCFYRAKIMQPGECGYVSVLFIDYGNSEEVLISELYQFLPELSNIPAQAVTCTLANVSIRMISVDEQLDFVSELTEGMRLQLLNKVLNCKVVGNQGDELQVIAYLDGLDISFHLERMGFLNRLETSSTTFVMENSNKSRYIPG